MADRLLRYILVLVCLLGAHAGLAAPPIIPPPPEIAASSYLLIDAASGKILVQHNAHERNPPASLTKIMTSYLAEQEIDAGRISADDEVLVSVNAWRTGG